jgi:hypothetical protein
MDRPEPDKVYALTGGSDEPSITNGNTWAESEVRRCYCGHLITSHTDLGCMLCVCSRRMNEEGEWE